MYLGKHISRAKKSLHLTYSEQLVLYVAACYYEDRGTPGLAWQDDQSTLKLALEQAILKLESRVC